jgi:hypothetical protein
LYILRASLEAGEPMTQAELARLLDIPLLSLQSFEAGRRARKGVSRELLQKIRLETGCVWDPTTNGWLFDLRLLRMGVPLGQQYAPVTPTLFAEYRAIATSSLRSDQKDSDLFLYKAWLDELFKRIPSASWFALSSRVNVFVEQCCRDFRLGDPVEFFDTVSRENRDIMDAITLEGLKGKSPSEIFSQTLPELDRALRIFGPESKAGQAILKMREELPKVLNALPSKASKKQKKDRPRSIS